MMSRFITDSGFNGLAIGSTLMFAAIFLGVIGFIFITRRAKFERQKELPFHDENQ